MATNRKGMSSNNNKINKAARTKQRKERQRSKGRNSNCAVSSFFQITGNGEKLIKATKGGGGGDRGSLWYRYQLIRYQVPPKLKVLVPPILGAGAINIVQLGSCHKVWNRGGRKGFDRVIKIIAWKMLG